MKFNINRPYWKTFYTNLNFNKILLFSIKILFSFHVFYNIPQIYS